MNGQGGMLRLRISDRCSRPLTKVFELKCREGDKLNLDDADMLLVSHTVHFLGQCQLFFVSEYYTSPSRGVHANVMHRFNII